MPRIKRYPNRKLYNTESKQYITLDQIAEMIRNGDEVSVIDNSTGEDITALTLTQIIYEQEKRKSGFLPHSVLASMIQVGGEGLTAFQRAVTSSRSYLYQIDEEIKYRIQKLIKQGELSEIEGKKILEKLLKLHKDEFDEVKVKQVLEDRQVPTRQELQELLDQLDELSQKIDQEL